jgi:2'-5' RNA ligase
LGNFLLMVPCPEVDPHVAAMRERFDPSSARGLKAHLTLLHASLPAAGLDSGTIGRLAAAASAAAPFSYQVSRIARFPGTLYLVVEPPEPFISLHEKFQAALPPGRRERPFVPHISVVRKSAIDDRGVESELAAMLARRGPIACACREIELFENSDGRWRSVRGFALSGDRDIPLPGLS